MREHSDIQDAYDRVADEYVRRIFHELDDKPFDREILNRFAQRVRGLGPVYDLGCGPGHVARYLHEHGVNVTGVDLSSGMVRRARELNPGIEFRQGDMCSLDVGNESLAGIVAFYSIVHFAPESLAAVFGELHRVLAHGAPLLLAFHIGNESIHLSEWWGHQVAVDFTFFDPEAIKAKLQEAGFRIAQALEREPYPEVEHQSRRAYLLAEASGATSSTRISRHVNAPRANVYRALVDARAIATWMVPSGMTSQVHVFDAREGGAFRISLTYNAPTGTGKTTAHTDTYHGRFVKLVPGEQVVEMMEFETADAAMRGEITFTFTLTDADGGTDVLAVHDNLPPGVSPADNQTGWQMALDKLAALVEAG